MTQLDREPYVWIAYPRTDSLPEATWKQHLLDAIGSADHQQVSILLNGRNLRGELISELISNAETLPDKQEMKRTIVRSSNISLETKLELAVNNLNDSILAVEFLMKGAHPERARLSISNPFIQSAVDRELRTKKLYPSTVPAAGETTLDNALRKRDYATARLTLDKLVDFNDHDAVRALWEDAERNGNLDVIRALILTGSAERRGLRLSQNSPIMNGAIRSVVQELAELPPVPVPKHSTHGSARFMSVLGHKASNGSNSESLIGGVRARRRSVSSVSSQFSKLSQATADYADSYYPQPQDNDAQSRPTSSALSEQSDAPSHYAESQHLQSQRSAGRDIFSRPASPESSATSAVPTRRSTFVELNHYGGQPEQHFTAAQNPIDIVLRANQIDDYQLRVATIEGAMEAALVTALKTGDYQAVRELGRQMHYIPDQARRGQIVLSASRELEHLGNVGAARAISEFSRLLSHLGDKKMQSVVSARIENAGRTLPSPADDTITALDQALRACNANAISNHLDRLDDFKRPLSGGNLTRVLNALSNAFQSLHDRQGKLDVETITGLAKLLTYLPRSESARVLLGTAGCLRKAFANKDFNAIAAITQLIGKNLGNLDKEQRAQLLGTILQQQRTASWPRSWNSSSYRAWRNAVRQTMPAHYDEYHSMKRQLMSSIGKMPPRY